MGLQHVLYYPTIMAMFTLLSTHAQDQVDTPLILDMCRSYVSQGDLNQGINAVQDLSCLSDTRGVGCFAQICRYCMMHATEQSKFYTPCQQHEESAQFELSTADCASLISTGDRNVGISAYYDSACPTGAGGGLGCQSNKCRFCKTWTTAQSQSFLNCPSTPAPVQTPAPTTDSTITNCQDAAAKTGLSSISFVVENKCNVVRPRLVGCIPLSTCQLCRTSKNEGNQYLVSCPVLEAQKKTETVSLAAIDSDTEQAQTVNETWVSLGAATGAVIAVALAILAVRTARRQRHNIKEYETPREHCQLPAIVNIRSEDKRFAQL